jgi:hypothetical protein
MKTTLTVAALVAGLVVAWLVAGRQLVLFVDSFATDGEAAPATGPFIASTSWLEVGDRPFELRQEGQPAADIRIDADATGRLTLLAHGKAFALGTRVAAPAPGPYDVPFAPDPGDTVTLRVAHSVLGWPTPFDLNFMTGNSPSWKRHVYYTLAWHKRDGATLDLTWRYEQWLYDDWGSPQMTHEGVTGLIRARIYEK